MLTIVAYITALIFELLQANYTNNISANEHFLDNMYRIVSILWIMVTLHSVCTRCNSTGIISGVLLEIESSA